MHSNPRSPLKRKDKFARSLFRANNFSSLHTMCTKHVLVAHTLSKSGTQRSLNFSGRFRPLRAKNIHSWWGYRIRSFLHTLVAGELQTRTFLRVICLLTTIWLRLNFGFPVHQMRGIRRPLWRVLSEQKFNLKKLFSLQRFSLHRETGWLKGRKCATNRKMWPSRISPTEAFQWVSKMWISGEELTEANRKANGLFRHHKNCWAWWNCESF